MLPASHGCQSGYCGGAAAVGEAGVGSHSCAQVLIPWFVSFPGCSLWGVQRNALWRPVQGTGVCEEHGHVGDLTFPVMVETSTSACSAVCMPSQPLSQNPCHSFVSWVWKGGIMSADQRDVWFGQERPELMLSPFSVALVHAPSHPLFSLLKPVLPLCSPDPWAGGRTRALVPSDRHCRWQPFCRSS